MTTPVSASRPASAMRPTQTPTLRVVVEQVEQPDRADQRERHREQHDAGLDERPGIQERSRKRDDRAA
jgi:cell division protein FtsN